MACPRNLAKRVGGSLNSVSVVPSRERGGHVECRFRETRQAFIQRRIIQEYLFVLMAGETAQRAKFGIPSDAMHRLAGANDKAMAADEVRLFMRMTDPGEIEAEVEAALGRALKWAKKLKVKWQILRLAHELLKRTVMTRGEVLELLKCRHY